MYCFTCIAAGIIIGGYYITSVQEEEIDENEKTLIGALFELLDVDGSGELTIGEMETFVPGLQVLWGERCFRRYQSGQRTVFSGAYIITVLQCVYTWLILQLCGRSGPTGTHGNSILTTKPRAQVCPCDGGRPVRQAAE